MTHAGLIGGRTYTWSSYNLPTELKVSSGADIQFEYGPDREKVRQVEAKGSMPATVDYVGGGLYENWMTATGTAQKNYIVTPNGLAAVVTRSSNLPDTVAYFHQDNLGSIIAMTDARGNLVQRYAYDAFGNRIVTANPAGIAGFGTQMGYTGHVQLDDLALVHMNGRVYDPVIGRFLSPDPNVQDPNNQQSLNRYAYVQNNPLSFTDPSGYFLSGFFHWFGHHWQMIAAVVVAVVASLVGQFEVWGVVVPAWGTAALGGFAAGLIASNGNLQDGLIGMAAALAFYGIGYQFQNNIGVLGDKAGAFVQKVAEHGIVGSLQSVAEGGRFYSGFLSAAVPESASLASGDYAMFGTGGEIDAGKVVAAAAIGGTASMLGGGKFANGAVTGAFGEAFNEIAHPKPIRNTPEELEMLKNGDVVGYYEARIAQGDAYAGLALDVVLDRGILGRLANWWLAMNVAVLPADQYNTLMAGGSYNDFVKRVQLGLAYAHAAAVDEDAVGVPGLLSANQISAYHEAYFTSLGLQASTFGGSAFFGMRTSYWCHGCDQNP